MAGSGTAVAARQRDQRMRAIERRAGAWQHSSDVEAGLNGVERIAIPPVRWVPTGKAAVGRATENPEPRTENREPGAHFQGGWGERENVAP